MAETWFLRNGTGAACGPGTRRDLLEAAGSSVATQDLATEHTWNRTETERSIATGDWSVTLRVTTGTGGGAPNKVTAVVERRNSSCVVQQTILNVQSGNLTAGSTETVTLTATGVAQIDFASGDILTVRVIRSNGTRTETLRFSAANPDDSLLSSPDEVSGQEFQQPLSTTVTGAPVVVRLTGHGMLATVTADALLQALLGDILKNLSVTVTGTADVLFDVVIELPKLVVNGTTSFAKQANKHLIALVSGTVDLIRGSLATAVELLATVTAATDIELDAVVELPKVVVTGATSLVRDVLKVLLLGIGGAANLTATLLKALAVTVVGTASLAAEILLTQALSATVQGVASLKRETLKLLLATVTGTTSLARQAGKVLSAVVVASPSLSFMLAYLRSLNITVIGSATLATAQAILQTLLATVTGTASLLANQAISQALSLVVTGTASLRRAVSKVLSLSVSGTTVISLKQSLLRGLSVIATASPVLSVAAALSQGISTIVTGTTVLATQFIAGGGPVGEFIRSHFLRRRRR